MSGARKRSTSVWARTGADGWSRATTAINAASIAAIVLIEGQPEINGRLTLFNVVGVLGGHRTDLYGAHQPAVGVIQDVAVEHPVAGLVEGHEQPGGGAHRNVDGVFPGQRAH